MTARVGAMHLGWDVVSVAAGGGGTPIRPVQVEGTYTPPAYLLADASGRLHTAGAERQRPDLGIAISDVRDVLGHRQIRIAGATWPVELVFRARLYNPLAAIGKHVRGKPQVVALPYPDDWPDEKIDEYCRVVEMLDVATEPLPESVALSGYVRALGLVRPPEAGRGGNGATGVYSDGRICLVVAVHGDDEQPTESVGVPIAPDAMRDAQSADNVVIEVMAAARSIGADTSTVLLTGNVCFNDALRLAFQNHLGHRLRVADHPMHALALGAAHLLVTDSEYADEEPDHPHPASGPVARPANPASGPATPGSQPGGPSTGSASSGPSPGDPGPATSASPRGGPSSGPGASGSGPATPGSRLGGSSSGAPLGEPSFGSGPASGSPLGGASSGSGATAPGARGAGQDIGQPGAGRPASGESGVDPGNSGPGSAGQATPGMPSGGPGAGPTQHFGSAGAQSGLTSAAPMMAAPVEGGGRHSLRTPTDQVRHAGGRPVDQGIRHVGPVVASSRRGSDTIAREADSPPRHGRHAAREPDHEQTTRITRDQTALNETGSRFTRPPEIPPDDQLTTVLGRRPADDQAEAERPSGTQPAPDAEPGDEPEHGKRSRKVKDNPFGAPTIVGVVALAAFLLHPGGAADHSARPVLDSASLCAFTPQHRLHGTNQARNSDDCPRLGVHNLRYTIPTPRGTIDPGPPMHI
ncbi:hypothetical protein [Nocardia wallacei]|uniref:hypothetical protein n=1 Tax=Nocardia wallacei TaxID=480035 RepID=UPI002454B14F|nr:hypothetical protein [Nocardia wallacei]